MARQEILRARKTNNVFRTKQLRNRPFERAQVKSIFELQPLEQRMFLSVTAPTVNLSLPQATFPPADATVHPMNQVQVSWSGASGSGESVSGYKVLMYQNNAWGTVGTVGAGTSSFPVTQQPDGTPLIPGTVYYFEVETLGSGGGTAYSNYLSIQTATQETEYIDNFPNNDAGGWTAGMTPFPSTPPNQAILGIGYVTGYYSGPVSGGSSESMTLHNVPAHTSIAITLDFLRLNLWQTGTVTVKANGVTIGTYDMTVAQPRLEGQIDFDQSLTVGCSQTNAPDADYDLFSRFVNDGYGGNGGNEVIEVDTSNVTEPSNEATGAAKWGLWGAGAYLLAPLGPDSPCPCGAGGSANVNANAANGGPGWLDGFSSGSSDGGSSAGTSNVDPFSGAVTVDTTDLSSSNFDGFGQARNWTSNTLFNGSGAVGVQTVSPQQSYLSQFGTGTRSLTESGNDSLWFDGSDASGWVERYGRHDILQHLSSGPNANQYQLSDTLGGKTFYYDFSSNWSSVLQGKLAAAVDANGNTTTYTYNASGQLTSVSRSYQGTTETFGYTYNPTGQLIDVALVRSGVAQRQAAYTYWSGTTSGGSAGDLQSVSILPATPAAPTATLASGGSLAVGTAEFYVVTAITPTGETDASPEVSITPTTGNQTVNLSWSAFPQATAYNIYRATASGTETFLVQVTGTTSYPDDGSKTPNSTAPPNGSIGTTVYRYYTNTDGPDGGNGYAHDLEYVFGPEAYARALAGGVNPLTYNPFNSGSDSDDETPLQQYADEYLVYDTPVSDPNDAANWGRVQSETLAGQGTYSFSYGSNTISTVGSTGTTPSPIYDAWVTKATETFPDGSTSKVYDNFAGVPVFKIFTDGTTGVQYPTFYKYDSSGHLLWTAHPSAFVKISGVYYNESNPDLVNDGGGSSSYLSQSSGLITGTDYYSTTTATSTTPGGVAGWIQDTYVQNGEGATKQLQESKDYLAITAGGATVNPVADDTLYGTAGGGDARVTRYSFTYASGTTQLLSETTIAPPITNGQNGTVNQNGPATSASDTADADTTIQYFDAWGRVVWQKDPDGFITYNQYDPATGAVVKQINDVNTADSSDFSGSPVALPSGWTTPTGGGQELITTYQVDGLGRITREQTYETDRVTVHSTTYMVYNDTYANNSDTDLQGIRNEVRTYRGWNSSTNTPTGPIEITREYFPLANSGNKVYSETLTSNAAPTVSNGVPTGAEALSASNIQSLSRSLTNDSGQVFETDDYSSLSGLTYLSATVQLSGAAVGSNTAAGNYSATSYVYDTEGRQIQTTDPNGTITKDTLDGLGQVTSVMVGISGANLVDVEDEQYDNGGTGDGNLTQVTNHVGGTAADRVTLNLYNFGDHLIATKQGALITNGSPNPSGETDGAHRLITFYTLDNLGETTGTYTYAGDQVPLTDFASWSDTGTDPAKMRAWTRTAYDDQGRVYQTVTVGIDPSNGVSGLTDVQIQALAGLTTKMFYDHRGNVIEESDPGGQVTKHAYDGAGRDIKDSTTDGGVLASAPQDWAHASSTSSDVVVEQTLNTYDVSGNLIETIDRQRFDNDPTTATGDLAGPGGGNLASRDYYTGMYYDLADRLTDQVNVGTYGGSAWTRPSSPPAGSDTVLLTHTEYDGAGRLLDTSDPRGLKTEHLYDMLGHETTTIGAWDGTQNPSPTNSGNQTTMYAYDANGDVLTMTASMPSGTNSQTTKYVYGVGSTGNLFSNDLIATVEYPDKTTGQASTLASNDQSFGYDFLGDKTSFTDQNGTTHAYLFDVLGRLTADKVTTFGAGVDQTVKRLGYSFDDAGRAFQQTSYSDANGTIVLNQVQDVYNGLGQLITEYQQHSGAVVVATSPKVQYGFNYMASGANNSRPTNIVYPNNRTISYGYNTGLDTTIGRVSSLIDSGVHLVDYTYLGLATIVQQSHPQPNITLTYIQQGSDPNPPPSYAATGGDRYTGLDQFGRVVDQLWMHGSVTTPTDRFQYAYDRDGNALYRKNIVQGVFSELYHPNGVATNSSYDNLNRLTDFRRGTLSSSGNNGSVLDTIADGSLNTLAGHTKGWTLDALGNWGTSTDVNNPSAAVSTDGTTQNRSHNAANQYTKVGTATLTYDNNGNMTTDERGYAFSYDAWNRMTISNGGVGHEDFFTYDADNRRPGISVCSGAVTDSYYSSDWQDLEDVAVTTGCGGGTTTSTYVWGQSYIDDLVERDSSAFGRQYAQQDANHDVTALVSSAGAVQERFIYDPYGTSTVLSSGWGNTGDSYQWVYRFQGGAFDAVSGLYNFRNRDYSPTLGRWMEEDPERYVDGASLYQTELSQPVTHVDPDALKATIPHDERWYWSCAQCLSASISFQPDPLAWQQFRWGGNGKIYYRVGWTMVATFTYAGKSANIDFHYDETGSLDPSNMSPNYAGNGMFFPQQPAVGGDHLLKPPNLQAKDARDGLGGGTATYTDNAGTIFRFNGDGKFRLTLRNYTVQAWCEGPANLEPVRSPKYTLTGSVNVTVPGNGAVGGKLGLDGSLTHDP